VRGTAEAGLVVPVDAALRDGARRVVGAQEGEMELGGSCRTSHSERQCCGPPRIELPRCGRRVPYLTWPFSYLTSPAVSSPTALDVLTYPPPSQSCPRNRGRLCSRLNRCSHTRSNLPHQSHTLGCSEKPCNNRCWRNQDSRCTLENLQMYLQWWQDVPRSQEDFQGSRS